MRHLLLALTPFLSLAAADVRFGSVDDPTRSTIRVGVAATYFTSDTYLDGTEKKTWSDDVEQTGLAATVGFQPFETLALEAKLGTFQRTGPDDAGGDEDGLLDSVVAATWRPISLGGLGLGLRGEAIIQGTYEPGFAEAPGNAANGAGLMAVLQGPVIPASPVSIDVGLGGRAYGEGVPPELVGWARAGIGLGATAVWVGFTHTESLSGHDFSEPGDPRDIHRVAGVADVSVSLAIIPTIQINAGVAKPLIGENKIEKTVFGLGAGFTF
jgi:hypothetical protein